MRINSNVAALNAWRNLTETNSNLDKSLERLSSGLRINKAADDAAGLAISEKMRAQINGLRTAQRNAQDGISLIQTAEGALSETHSILQRMRELAVQSANDTYTASDRQELQKEVDQLASELTRIAADSEFNTQKLLNGTFEGTFHIGANEGQSINVAFGDMRAYALGATGDPTFSTTAPGAVTVGADTVVNMEDGTYTVRENDSGAFEMVDTDGLVVATSADGLTFAATGSDDSIVFTEGYVKSGSVTISGAGTSVVADGATVVNTGLEPGTYTVDVANDQLLDANGDVVATTTDDITYVNAAGDTVLQFLVAVTADKSVEVGGADITTQAQADRSLAAINGAIDDVSSERAKLGAYQNRLEHTIINLGTAAENLTSAESRIRDVDMALEMSNFTKHQILSQAGTAMLAQANMKPQSVLQLLG